MPTMRTMGVAVLLAFAVAACAHKPKGGSACATEMDCQLNGVCSEGKCVCDSAWTGTNCSTLHVLPAKGAAYREQNASSWGGRSIYSDGKYHAFFSEFGGTCGMNAWDNVSQIIHAISDDPAPADGYQRLGVAIPQFAHCVDPVQLPDGTWLMFHNGDGQPRPCGGGSPDCDKKPIGPVADCSAIGNGTTHWDKISYHPAPKLPEGFEPQNGAHQSSSPYGPWVKPPAAALEGMPFCDCPAVHALANGSVAMWCQPLIWGTSPGNEKPIYINQGWGTPFEAKPTTIHVPDYFWEAAPKTPAPGLPWIQLDDPTMWTDTRGNWHVLAHNGDGPFPCGDSGPLGLAYRDGDPYPIGCSSHLYSRDGINWVMSPVAASNSSIQFEDGQAVNLFRERPKVLVNPSGQITHLFHGSMRCGERPVTGGREPESHCTNTSWPSALKDKLGINAPDGLDYSFTTVVPLNQQEVVIRV